MEFLKNILSSAIGSVIGLLVAGTILIFIFVAVLVGGIVGAIASAETIDVSVNEEEANVLVMDLSSAIVERGGAEPVKFDLFSIDASAQIGLDQILEGLDRAAEDENIVGIFLNISGVSAMPATLEDIREGLEEFKESGKWIVAWSEGMTQTGYYMNSVADEVYLHPNGLIEIDGLKSQVMFYPGMFEKLGMDVTVLRGPNNKYKSAVEPFLRKNFSEANKEQLEALLGDFWRTMQDAIARNRNIDASVIDDIANNMGIRIAEHTVEYGLVDALLYEDEIDALLEEKVGEDEVETISFMEYTIPEMLFGIDFEDPEAISNLFANDSDSEDSDSEELGGEIAVIYAVGAIESGAGDATTIGSETIAGAIREARLAPDVKAVVLRVNSPGGSALASDVIWRETVLLKEAGKHFVVSMGDLAASGGYYISTAADRIFANNTTITGSIGVFGMIPNVGGAYESVLGVTFDKITTHDHAGQPDGLFAMTQSEIDAYNEVIVNIYEDFTSKVSDGRGLSAEKVEEAARGRVWTGEDALEIGLVDEIGSLEDAIAYAEGLIEGEGEIEKVFLPEFKDPFEMMFEDLIGVRSGLEALNLLGADDRVIDEIISVKRMIESGDVIQARMPYNLYID